MKRVALIGLGLMGGSLGLALKARSFKGTIAAYARRAATRDEALSRGMVDEVYDEPAKAAEHADLVIFCTPILTIPGLVSDCLPGFKKGALITDVGSTKTVLTEHVSHALRNASATFIGSHPIAGSEQQGLSAARDSLYEGAVVVVTPPDGAEKRDVDRISRFWTDLGSVVTLLAPEEHDELMARTSHLPHLVASLVVATAGRDGDVKRLGSFCGSGFRDTTRVADGSPVVWHDIVSTNPRALLEELKALRGELDELIADIGSANFEGVKHFLEHSRTLRRELMKNSPAS